MAWWKCGCSDLSGFEVFCCCGSKYNLFGSNMITEVTTEQWIQAQQLEQLISDIQGKHFPKVQEAFDVHWDGKKALSLYNHISHKPCLNKIASGLLLQDTTTSCKGSSNMRWEEPRSHMARCRELRWQKKGKLNVKIKKIRMFLE
ncbi:hypothetical protein IGI04_038182 [Brassica rapa subsp. trilocularis]|uniref:Uncharacterized protein n=1 Tax=Brassica rapa subsp. trilocularis TaxID=1813537 RepID=A0ABQ7LKD9_BRACM|nr:hypothetical protein IGI04_038182 [Brassica rapa subsp. trilocularis]